ncbi:MAG: hypothetical protein FGM22_07315 [Burkholderiaceae bacterium]|nr:hypothetical protein [Burkholderiaceae bacterium]
MPVRIDTPQGDCTKKPQPGTVCLQKRILDKFSGTRSMGIYNCRSVRGADNASVHSEGRAMDIGPKDAAQGDEIAAWAVSNSNTYQIQRVIWNRRIWDANGAWREYKGQNPHTDHLHIEQNWIGANTCGPAARGLYFAGATWWQYAIVGMVAIGMIVAKNRNKTR